MDIFKKISRVLTVCAGVLVFVHATACQTGEGATSDDEESGQQAQTASAEEADDVAFAERDWSDAEYADIEKQLMLGRDGLQSFADSMRQAILDSKLAGQWEAAAEEQGEKPLIYWHVFDTEGDGSGMAASALHSRMETDSVNHFPVDVMSPMQGAVTNPPPDMEMSRVDALAMVGRQLGVDYVGTGRVVRTPRSGIAKSVTYEFTVYIVDAESGEKAFEETATVEKTATAP